MVFTEKSTPEIDRKWERMRDLEQADYALVYDGKAGGMRYKKIEKPVIKKKRFQYKVDEETGQRYREDVSRDSDKLELDIFNEKNLDEANYNIKVTKGAFEGSFGDSDDGKKANEATFRKKKVFDKDIKLRLSPRGSQGKDSNEAPGQVLSAKNASVGSIQSKTVSVPPDKVVNE